jgi:cell division septation protein DedD
LKAANLNIVDAQYHIAELYRLGLGIDQNLEEAHRWYQAAAKGGNADAVRQLAALELETKFNADGQTVSPPEAPTTITEAPATPSAVETEATAPPETAAVVKITPPVKPPVPEKPGEAVTPAADAADVAATEPATPTTEGVVSTDPAVPSVPETSVASVPPTEDTAGGSGFKIQIASVKSAAGAEQTWAILLKDFPDVLGGLNHSVRQVDLGTDKGIWYRIYAGPVASRAVAQDLCGKYKAKSAKNSCLVVAE